MTNRDLLNERTSRALRGLVPAVQARAVALVEAAHAAGIEIAVISGFRSLEEQKDLYEQGRIKPGAIVTNSRPGYSTHNFGIAFDVGVFADEQYLPESSLYAQVGSMGIGLGLAWGGTWRSFRDPSHFEAIPLWGRGLRRSELLRRLRAGELLDL